jgi:diadenosine tetraphosphate (Ap4A) HIT family hydrolase
MTNDERGSMAPENCTVCAEIAGRISAPGGVVYRNDFWEVAHHTGPQTDPGELIVKLRRHAESLADLTPPEAAGLGPVLQAAVGAVERVVRPERVYVASYGERVRHVHFFLLPRTTSLPAGHVTSDLYRRARTLLRRFGLTANPPTAARADAAARLRDDVAWTTLST